MKLQTILELPECTTLVKGNPEREITKVFCCDLLSIAMGRAPAGCAWVTVMGNKNTLAVASLTDTACIVLAEGVTLDADTLAKAEEEGIAVLATGLPVFDAALKIYQAGEL
ncbi:MAG TPA: hypothetical protein H9852_07740 [Candidatus Mediterraneibacter colneyensis]|nr:hypothetical protein [Candidatus Mediterraneibacter colneyensis]